jgi:hypothetical protein
LLCDLYLELLQGVGDAGSAEERKERAICLNEFSMDHVIENCEL